MSWLSDIGDTLSSGFSSIARPLGSVLGAAAPLMGGALGGTFGGPMGAALGSSLGQGVGGMLRGNSGQSQSPYAQSQGDYQSPYGQSQSQYGSPISPETYSLAPTPSPNIAGGGIPSWMQNTPMSQMGGQLGQMGGSFLNNQLQQNLPSWMQNSTAAQLPGALGQQLGQMAGSYLPQSWQGLAGALGNLGQTAGNIFSQNYGSNIPEQFRNTQIGQMGTQLGGMAGNYLNNQAQERMPAWMQNQSLNSMSNMGNMGYGGQQSMGQNMYSQNNQARNYNKFAMGGPITRAQRDFSQVMNMAPMY